MPSQLTFPSTQIFRDNLLSRNLSPYTVPGSYSPPGGVIVQETILRDLSVVDSPDYLIEDPPANQGPIFRGLYTLNEYGPVGGFGHTINQTQPLTVNSNSGEYDVMDTSLPQQSLTGAGWPGYNQGVPEQGIPAINKYSFTSIQLQSIGNIINTPTYSQYNVNFASLPQQSLVGLNWPPGSGVPEQDIGMHNKYAFNNLQLISINNLQAIPTFKQYAQPLSFIPSSYSPYQIILQDDPTGSNGSLSQDSYIAQLGSKILKKDLEERINANIFKNTQGRLNFLRIADDPILAIQIAQGEIPLIERDWVITRASNLLVSSLDFAARLGGFYYPGSEIPGDYFETEEGNLSIAGQIASALTGNPNPQEGFLGNIFGRFFHQKSPSQLFLNNTGQAQQSQLFYTLRKNRYGPLYDFSAIGTIPNNAATFLDLLFDRQNQGGYYVGAKGLEPGTVDGPPGKLPLNMFGIEVNSPVYGPDKLADVFEPDLNNIKFGLAGEAFYGIGGLAGGLTWSTKESDKKLGFHVGKKGNQEGIDPEYDATKSYLSIDLSTTDKNFREGSILWNTQKLVESGEGDPAHAGNAINQISKVFNDGYREITKGSRVMTYVDQSGVEVGKEYCRVFTKDTPYFTFGDLQKRDGNIRKYSYSVLDNTYNLNISPLKGTSTSSSTNIKDGRVKKYMFSIENLAWRTSNRPGFTYLDLPECERGPNGGRIMWFPPYDLVFTENVTPSFEGQSFLGRPEPVYTYRNTTRTGNLGWKMIVDHPSILNAIVDKELKGKNKDLINDIIDSFFSGCKKYDIYELAKKYNTIPISDLYTMQQVISNPNLNQEAAKAVLAENKKAGEETKITPQNIDLSKWNGFGYYFDNDVPPPGATEGTTTVAYDATYNTYVSKETTYLQAANTQEKKDSISNFFTHVVKYNFSETEKLLTEIYDIFEKNKKEDGLTTSAVVELELVGSASSPNTAAYNEKLSSRRISSVLLYFESWGGGKLKKYLDSKVLKITNMTALGEKDPSSQPRTDGSTLGPFTCTDDDTGKPPYDKIYSPNAMACRRVVIKNAKATIEPANKPTSKNTATPPGYVPAPPVPANISVNQKLRDGISKKILRSLLSECDYFTLIEEQNPMFHDTIKEKIKYFSPAFHSMTPEGLNSRLTFLQQCTRPGDTIPIIGTDGKPKYTSAVNTSFGAPPVLVLRIGDFYNTKIIPTSLTINYEPLVFDINPEGIGVQPMIAKINLQFNFVGGSGLKEPIDKLQNALSFNFYANTEMYDERADWTDDSFKKIDEDIIKALEDKEKQATVNDANNVLANEGGTTIGVITEKTTTDQGTSGTTTFQKIMDDGLLKLGQSYITTIVNKASQVITDYNIQVYSAFIQDRSFVDGETGEFTTPDTLKIFGKPSNFEEKVTKLFTTITEDINAFTNTNKGNTEGLEYIYRLYENNYKSSTIKKVKQNLINIVNKRKPEIIGALTLANTDISNCQIELVRTFAKLDVVDTLTDGYVQTDQSVKIYNLSATTEVQSGSQYTNTAQELYFDYMAATDILFSFYDDLSLYGLLDLDFKPESLREYDSDAFIQISNFTKAEVRFYTAMSKIILNKTSLNTFISELITADIAQSKGNTGTLLDFTKSYFDTISGDYKEEYDEEVKIVDNFKNIDNYKNNYQKWTPYNAGKVRKFTFSDYTDGTDEQKTRLGNLYKNGNSNPDMKTFNGKNKFN